MPMPPYRGIEPFKHLEKQIDSMTKSHQLIVNLLKTPNLANVINGLNNPEVRRAASADPLKAAQEAGLNLPETGVSIQIHEFPHNWEVEIQVELGHSIVILEFNSLTGFRTS
ncbi:MAG: hypothetical protein M3Y27_12910 [Acidobacteriota bacterium]|nr:hypothetical protein [Acidobacteriota bacterium]